MVNILAVDSGKYLTKAVSIDENGDFKRTQVFTKMKRTTQPKSALGGGKVVGLDGKYYIVGQGTLNSPTTSKMEEIHKRCTYSQIPEHFPNGSEIVLAIGCPLSDYKNLKKREAYKRFMLGLSEDDPRDLNSEPVEISFELEGIHYTYTVKKLAVFPEGSGMLLKYEHLFKDKTVAITDIGGLNVNVSVYRSLVPDVNTFFTLEKGGNKFRSLLQQELNSNIEGCNINSMDEMDEIIAKGYVEVSGNPKSVEESRELIQILKEEFLEEIIAHLWDLNLSVNTTEFIFVGGGSLLFRNEIMERNDIKKFISNNAQWENAEGFAVAAAKVFDIKVNVQDFEFATQG